MREEIPFILTNVFQKSKKGVEHTIDGLSGVRNCVYGRTYLVANDIGPPEITRH